jgi:biopolymer transport protein TolR
MEMHARKRRKPMAEINVVPLIDVMLVLLVVFMITTPMITQGIKIELPEANSEVLDDPEETLEITVNAEGQYFINLGETAAENPTPVPVEQIGQQVGAIMASNPTVPVYIGGADTVDYGVIIKLITTLQEAGVREPRLLTQPAGLEP